MSTDQPGDRPPWDQPYASPQAVPQTPRKKGLSAGCIVLIVLAILGGLVMLLCCGGFVGMGYYFRDAVSDDPAVIARVSAEIDVPGELEPKASFKMNVPFSDRQLMTWVVYMDEATQSMLMLGTFGEAMAGMDRDEFQRGLRQSMEEQGVAREENVAEWHTHEKEITVRGEPVTFFFATGEDDSGNPRIQVTGTFQGDRGPVMVTFSGDAEKYPEERITEVIESIR